MSCRIFCHLASIVMSTGSKSAPPLPPLCLLGLMAQDRKYWRGKYHCTVDLLFDWFGLVCFENKNKICQLSCSWFQTSQTGGQWYSDTSPFSILCSRQQSWLPPLHQSGGLWVSENKAPLWCQSFDSSQSLESGKTKLFSLASFNTSGKMLTSTDPW